MAGGWACQWLTRKRGCAVFAENFARLGNTQRQQGYEPLLRLHTAVRVVVREDNDVQVRKRTALEVAPS